ncbi:VOC family protein [Paraburkholderia sartisoli]|uniref:Catechol 2,3-dioxygenase n=1 Tax=Paraburkholderia sartisoli TaxID=83784 RepID=A0A1H3ZZH1_9BURK|nr:VOC family protein [Paraburkholderia sartisoli]SEA29106.1 Catechol 2,3-dioxygenase [Paraburkholderia sartisoli]
MSALPPILGLHHFAWRCRNAEETRHFYEDILGLPLVHLIRLDRVPSTGEYCPYVHLFFEMADGSNIAFFDLGDNTAAEPSPNTPPWVNHIALRLATPDQLEAMKQRLVEHGIDVLGVTDHHFVRSIYFFDPNGFRLELTVPVAPAETLERYRMQARPALDAWAEEQKRAVPETPAA